MQASWKPIWVADVVFWPGCELLSSRRAVVNSTRKGELLPFTPVLHPSSTVGWNRRSNMCLDNPSVKQNNVGELGLRVKTAVNNPSANGCFFFFFSLYASISL